MRARIHRGAREIGGSCVELEHDGRRLVVDVGRPLNADRDADIPLPAIDGLGAGDEAITGLVISHGHPDHYGLAEQVHPSVPVFIGEASARILNEARFFGATGAALKPGGYLRDREPLDLDPYRVTPYLMDHSAFDAYTLLVEAGGRRLLYTGDVRAHGRKAGRFEALVRQPPADVDVLLLEGTHVGREHEPPRPSVSEADVEARGVELFKAVDGMVLAAYSPQNIDRLVTLHRAAKRSGRVLVLDLYAATITAATGYDTIPQADWEGVRVFVPLSQRIQVKRAEEFERTERIRAHRVYPEQLAAQADHLVMTFRGSMAGDLERAACLAGAHAVWSMWPGYLEDDAGHELRGWLERHGIPLSIVHASGHATVADLQRLARAINAHRIVPIHTAASERFPELFERVELHPDGDWWRI